MCLQASCRDAFAAAGGRLPCLACRVGLDLIETHFLQAIRGTGDQPGHAGQLHKCLNKASLCRLPASFMMEVNPPTTPKPS